MWKLWKMLVVSSSRRGTHRFRLVSRYLFFLVNYFVSYVVVWLLIYCLILQLKMRKIAEVRQRRRRKGCCCAVFARIVWLSFGWFNQVTYIKLYRKTVAQYYYRKLKTKILENTTQNSNHSSCTALSSLIFLPSTRKKKHRNPLRKHKQSPPITTQPATNIQQLSKSIFLALFLLSPPTHGWEKEALSPDNRFSTPGLEQSQIFSRISMHEFDTYIQHVVLEEVVDRQHVTWTFHGGCFCPGPGRFSRVKNDFSVQLSFPHSSDVVHPRFFLFFFVVILLTAGRPSEMNAVRY